MADTLDVVTFDEARSALSYGATFDDTAMASAVTAVSRRLDSVFGAMVTRTVTDEQHWSSGRLQTIQLDHWPVSSYTSGSIFEDSVRSLITAASETETAIYPRVDLETGAMMNPDRGAWPEGRVVVTYDAGRYADTAAVDALVKESAIVMLRNVWESSIFDTTNVGGYDSPAVAFPTIDIPTAVFDPGTRTGLLADMARLPAVA